MKILPIFLLVVIAILLLGCSSDSPTGSQSTVPVLTTASPSAVTRTTAQSGGTITSDGGSTVTERGVCWSTGSTPTMADSRSTNGSGTGFFPGVLEGLTGLTRYYVRAYATNSVGTGYGNIMSFFTTDSTGTVSDIDGNSYRTVKIGTQWWMAENLKVLHYRNGDPVTNVPDSASWGTLATEAYCDPYNDPTRSPFYGRLYNWYAVSDSRILAPAGWHVANDAEWQTLVDSLGGDSLAGGKMKTTGTTIWITPNAGATNESGFSGVPAGFRWETGQFYGSGAHANFWTATSAGGNTAWYRFLHCTNAEALRFSAGLTYGFSVRCVKD